MQDKPVQAAKSLRASPRRKTGAAARRAAEAADSRPDGAKSVRPRQDAASRQASKTAQAVKESGSLGPLPPKPPKRTGRSLTKGEIVEVFRRFQAIEPHPKGELNAINTFTFLVAVVLSAQATDAGVNKATPALFALADTPEKMLALGEERVRDLIKTIGLYRAKAKNVIALSKRLVEVYGGKVPDNRADLETLPGVGRKTANVVLNNAYGVAVIAVDTHLFRVSNRIPLAKGKTPLEVELGLEKVVPEAFKQHAHHWLILHGRYVCKARRPACGQCVIADLCHWPDKDLARVASPDPA